MSNSNQDKQEKQNDFSKFIVEYILQPVQNNTVGYGTINYDKLKKGDFSDFSAPMSNAMKLAASLYHVTAYETLASFKVKNDEIASLKKIDGHYISILHNLAEQKRITEISVEQINHHIAQAKSAVKIAYWNNVKSYFESSLNDIEKNTTQILNAKNLDTSLVKSSSQEILDKIGGDGYAKEFLGKMDKIFNYANFFRQATATISLNENSSEADVFNYTAGWFNVLSGFSDNSVLSKIMPTAWSNKALSLLPSMSSKAIVASVAKGVVAGIVADVTYKLSYEGAKWLFSTVFYKVFGEQLYEMDWFLNLSENAYSTIFQHLTADKLNAVIAFNTMLLGNFVNAQGKSVILEDTATLLGSDDYKQMSFDKALKHYKAIYKLISGNNDADGITDELSMIKHMEKSYEAFKQLRGQKLIIAQNDNGIIETFKNEALSDKPDAQAYRYAFVNFNPFVLLGADYNQHNQNGNLDLYSNDNLNGLTAVYLEKRAEMLSAWLKDSLDSHYTPNNAFVDLALDIRLDKPNIDYSAGNNGIKKHQSEIIFGGNKDDIIKAKDIGDNINYLFGNHGNDILDGGAGNDYMEGGTGFDTYILEDNDIIFDSDGQGKLQYANGAAIPTLIQTEKNLWIKTEGTTRYIALKEDNNLILTQQNTQNEQLTQTTIKNFFIHAHQSNNHISVTDHPK